MVENVISVVAALIRDVAGRVLLVRKRGTAAFMQPGGKRAVVYAVNVEGAIAPKAEIDWMVWVDPKALPDLHLAPLTRDHVLPLARTL